MKLKIKIALTAIFCLFLLSPSIFACHDCNVSAEITTDLTLLLPLRIFVEPDANEHPPIMVAGTTIYPPYNYPPGESWSYGWTVLGSANFNVQFNLPDNNSDGLGVSFTGFWYMNKTGYPYIYDGHVDKLVYDPIKYQCGKLECRLVITSVTAAPGTAQGLHTVNQEVSVMYYGI